jgi:nucleotidyltransferase/DNA polymerase involved in DNA repair
MLVPWLSWVGAQRLLCKRCGIDETVTSESYVDFTEKHAQCKAVAKIALARDMTTREEIASRILAGICRDLTLETEAEAKHAMVLLAIELTDKLLAELGPQ